MDINQMDKSRNQITQKYIVYPKKTFKNFKKDFFPELILNSNISKKVIGP